MLNIKKRLIGLPNAREAFELQKVFEQCYNTQCLGSAVLAINGASAATWMMTNTAALPYIIDGKLYSKTALTAQAVPAAAALTNTGYQAVMVTIGLDYAGNMTTYTSTVGTSSGSAADALSKVVPAQIPEGVCVIGGLIIQSNATTFTPATTALDAAGITVLYFNTTGPFFPVSPI